MIRACTRLITVGIALAAGFCTASASVTSDNRLLPQPVSIQAQEGGPFLLHSGMTVALGATRSPRLEATTLRALKRMEDIAGISLPRALGDAKQGELVIQAGPDPGPVQGVDDDESYALTANAQGIRISAATTTGAIHGLETLLQLIQTSSGRYVVPAVVIQDTPRFRWRGLMIDCARHFEPLDLLKRNIDAMAAVKLNVFHWHLIDDQGFRIESKLFPKLTALGSDNRFYTQDEARELVRYAHDRGIRVVPEFEMPGHSTAWLVAYPELNSGTQPSGIRREFGVSDIALDPTREETYQFISRFLGEMAGVFPDEYMHIGGDETPAPDWKTNPRILAFKKAHDLKDNEALQAYFNTRVLGILSGLHKKMVGWDEIFNPALPRDVVVQSWRGEASLAKGAAQGYQGVLSAPYYLDGMKTAGEHYLADPVPASTSLTPEQQKLILGGEVCMWAEHLDERTIESRIWPRTAAIAERFWSAQNVRDVDDMYRRLLPVSIELESFGLRHLSSRDTGLRALAGTTSIDALRTFSGAFEPVSFGERYHQQRTSQLTPLTSFVDAVTPDPPAKHALAAATQAILHDPADKDAAAVLRTFFTSSRASLPAVREMQRHSPRLAALSQRTDQLEALDAMALEALDAIMTNKAQPKSWQDKAAARLAEAKLPSQMVRFIFLDSLQQLVAQAGVTR